LSDKSQPPLTRVHSLIEKDALRVSKDAPRVNVSL